MAFPKFQWVIATPGLENRWARMKDYVTIMRRRNLEDDLGGTPYANQFEDYLTGPDGNGVYAEVLEPKTEEALMQFGKVDKTTHTIVVKYDDRIKEEMACKWLKYGQQHIARIVDVTNENNGYVWMRLICEEFSISPGVVP